MTRLLNYFLRGLVFVVPIAVTVYVCVAIFTTIDGWLGRWLGLVTPGAGFLLTIGFITLIGFFASSFLTRGLMGLFDSLVQRVPFVRLVYASVKDFLNAFVGEQRRFDKPVLVQLAPGGNAHVVGFITQESLEAIGFAGYVAVYLPFSYSLAGWLHVFPAESIRVIDAESPELMAFVVSGGVTSVPARRQS